MSALANLRHERFARAFIKTNVAARAYLKAGYTANTRNALDASSSRLLGHAKVQSRIKELRRQMAARNRVTVDSLLQDLADDRALARDLGQPGAAIQATQLSAKLVGLLVDRKESGAPGDFAGMQSREEVLALVRAELGDETAALLAKALGKQEDSEPVDAVADVTRDAESTLQ
jgi:phage terminase small subunit